MHCGPRCRESFCVVKCMMSTKTTSKGLFPFKLKTLFRCTI